MIVLIFIVLFFVIFIMMINSEIERNHCKMELEQAKRELCTKDNEIRSLERDVEYYHRICDDRAKTISELYQMIHDLQEKK